MNRFIYIFLLVILIFPAYSQYNGGNADGYSQLYLFARINEQDLYCSGGTGDGFSVQAIQQPLNLQGFYCSGGIGDGFDRITASGYLYSPANFFSGGNNDGSDFQSTGYTTFFDQAIYLAGGINDGFSGAYSGYTTISNTAVYATGGSGDGFNTLTYSGPVVLSPAWEGGTADGFANCLLSSFSFSPAFYCLGGTDDGASSLHGALMYFGPGIWLGSESQSWENPANWSGNAAPDVSIDVLIPGGKPYYPLVTSGGLSVNSIACWFKCKSLTIREGASLFNKTDLYLFGEMTVSGLYQADDAFNNHVFIYPGGNLTLHPTGIMNVGHP